MMLKRIFLILLQVLAIYIVTFMLLHLIPGDPIQVMLGESASLADQNKLRMQLGLDKSIYLQLSSSLVKVFQGDFGVSILNHKPVLEQLINAGRNTYILAGASLLIALSCGLMGGIISAKFHNLSETHPICALTTKTVEAIKSKCYSENLKTTTLIAKKSLFIYLVIKANRYVNRHGNCKESLKA